mmetsp:Transcript_48728/g.125630  ORF Transcript_48728/g.125630 Transcript_48728/m.125630 type:complete len:340 (+) Transcript_48728:117-1136(+)
MTSIRRSVLGSEAAGFVPGDAQEDTALFPRRQIYGGVPPAAKMTSPALARSQRQKLNIVAACQCLLLPWVLFCLLFAVQSFHIHYRQPELCHLCVVAGLLCVILTGMLAVRAVMQKVNDDPTGRPNWWMFLFLTTLAAFVLAVMLGDLNYNTNMKPYYDYSNLNDHSGVNPSTMRGQQLMDAGRVLFTNNATLDLRRSMGFVNLDTYCVAPISVRSEAAGELIPLYSYDFWAVGLDCCSGSAADFHCGEFNNPNAHSGLRLLHDEQRAFFRLAVQQAEAAYGIRATHPLFFHWAQDAGAEMDTFHDEGIKYYMIGMILHFGWQLLCVGLAAVAFSKMNR